MCGISGCLLRRPLNDHDLQIMRRVREALTHRGPDDDGEFVDAARGIYFGHRRLSIIDLDPRSAQPMQRDEAIIVYNGEIYNFSEIAEQLKTSFSFTTKGDTEVILRAWQKWGRKALEKFDGMFAFVLRNGEETVFATDAFGEKPLYYLERPEGVYFASEPGPLIHEFSLKFSLSPEIAGEFMSLGFIRPPATGYPGLSQLPPASVATLRRDGRIEIVPWWCPPQVRVDKGRIKPFSENEIDKLRDLLCASLQARLRADVPLGLFLSGGVDSSLIAALAGKELGQRLQAFTVAFPDGQDESQAALKIAGHLSLPHQVIDSKEAELWRKAPYNLIDLYGVPNDNMTVFAVYQMCRAAKPFLTVALSGLGGDELFYGYNKYELLYRNRLFYRYPVLARIVGAGLKGVLPRAETLEDLMAGGESRKYLRVKNGPALRDLETEGIALPEDLLSDSGDLVHRVRNFDLTVSMPQSYIPAVDRGSMRAAIEVRTPFLNRALFDYIASLDQRRLIAFGMKGMTRNLLERYLPLDYLSPGKQGFVYPSDRYFSQTDLPLPGGGGGMGGKFTETLWAGRRRREMQPLCLRLALLSQVQEERRI